MSGNKNKNLSLGPKNYTKLYEKLYETIRKMK